MDYIRIHPADDVAVALRDLKAGEHIVIDNTGITLKANIPRGHKIMLHDMPAGADITKYGFTIGHITHDIRAGQLLDHNELKTNLSGTLQYEYHPTSDIPQPKVHDPQTPTLNPQPKTIQAYVRPDGQIGIRNELWIVPTVGCVNGICHRLATNMQAWLDTQPDSDIRVVAYTHNYGCSQLSDDHEATRHILRDLVLHPNAGGVLIVGLGCENNQPDAFIQLLGNYDTSRIRMMVTQQIEGDETETGLDILRQIATVMQADRRTTVPVSRLRIGLKCGGSDGLSGITANPLLGRLSDWLTSCGGTTVLTEVPEMFGAETLLMARCSTRQLFNQTVEMVNGFKQYFLSHGEPVGENPSPGNKAGGISTLEEKALGCTQKAGTAAPVNGVLRYGDRISHAGLNLLCAPGNDLVASTALAAAGCHIILFTTGRGTPFGTFVPTLKISTNSELARLHPTWIDFNAGRLTEDATMEHMLNLFIQKIIDTASGQPTWNERKGYQEIAIWKNGVTL